MADAPGSSSAPADDFIHVSMEKSTNSALTDSYSSRSPYSQVVFHDLSEVYPTDGDITFTYSFQPGVIAQIGDRVALYKVGWSSVSEYVASVFANPPDDAASPNKTNKISFSVEILPKDEINMYQFCYITSGNIVAGSSIPFTFRKPLGNELVAVEDPNDSGLVVFRSRVTQLQEKLEKTNTEKEMLEKTINELKSELYLVKSELNEKTQKCDLHKENLQDMTAVIYDLNTEKKALLEKLDKTNELKKQVGDLDTSLKELGLNMNMQQEEIETYKKEIASKEATIVSLKEEIAMLEETVNLLNKSLSSKEENSKASIDALQSQLQQANETISHFRSNMDSMEAKFEEKLCGLKQKYEASKKIYEENVSSLKEQISESNKNVEYFTKLLSESEEKNQIKCDVLISKNKEMTEKNNSFLAENFSLTQEVETLKTQIKTLDSIVKSKDETMKNMLETNGEHGDRNRRLFLLEDENSLLQVQVVSLEERLQACEADNKRVIEQNKTLREEKLQMADHLSKMNEEVRKYKLASQSRCHTHTHSHQTSSSQQTGSGPSGASQQRSSTDHKGPFPFPQISQFIPFFPFQGAGVNISTTCGEASPSAPPPPTHDCEKCRELDNKVKTLMLEKADIRSDLIQTKHANEEYCKHLREANEEAAAMRSRIAVLEIELRKAKEVTISSQGEQKYKEMIGVLSASWKKDEPMQTSSAESMMMDSVEKQKLEEELNKERETKALLQRNVEGLMLSDAQNFATIDKLKKEILILTAENNQMKDCQRQLDQVVNALDTSEKTKNEVLKNYYTVNFEKTKLEGQLIELRKDSVGKVSLNDMQKLREENEELKKQLVDKECCKKLKEKLEAAGEAAGLSIGRIPQQQLQQSMDGWSMPAAPSGAAPIETQPSASGFTCPVCFVAFPPDSVDSYNKHFGDHFD